MSDVPKDLKFTKTHEWLKTENDEMIIGITAHAQALLGDMVYVELPAVGSVVAMGDELGVVESVKAASDFYTPVSGTVIEINQRVNEDPALVNKEPYAAGWLVKIKPSNAAEVHDLLDAEQYQTEIAEEL
jgi:glycine cleavage system H protein